MLLWEVLIATNKRPVALLFKSNSDIPQVSSSVVATLTCSAPCNVRVVSTSRGPEVK